MGPVVSLIHSTPVYVTLSNEFNTIIQYKNFSTWVSPFNFPNRNLFCVSKRYIKERKREFRRPMLNVAMFWSHGATSREITASYFRRLIRYEGIWGEWN